MTPAPDRFTGIVGARRGGAGRQSAEDELASIEARLDARSLLDFAERLLDRISHPPHGQRCENHGGEVFFRYPARFPCAVEVSPLDLELRERLNFQPLSGTATAVCWYLGSPDADEPAPEALYRGWEIPLGGYSVVNDGRQLLLRYPAKAGCEIEVQTGSGELVHGLLQAFLIPLADLPHHLAV